MNVLFSRFGLFAVLVALLLPTSAVANTGGLIDNRGGFIENLEIGNGDRLYNSNEDFGDFSLPGEIVNLQMHGGNASNGALIYNMTYFGGIFSGTFEDVTGTIGTLNIAGDAREGVANWGTVNNLAFAPDGSGVMTISGFVNDGVFGFTGIDVTDSVNLARAGISLDMSAFGTFNSFDAWETGFFGDLGFSKDVFTFANLFGTDNVDHWDALTYFELAWSGGTQTLFNGTDWHGAWGITSMGVTAAIPEPATLAILGLGLAGLGLARRRMMKATAA